MKLDAGFNSEIFRKDHPMIIASNRHLASIVPVRLAYDADGYEAGTVLGKVTASGHYAKYDNSNSDGSETAVGVLFEAHAVEEFENASGTILARAIVGGELYESKLVGLDANAKTDLKSRTITAADGVAVLKF